MRPVPIYIILTLAEKYIMPIPIGINATPITKKVGKTVPAVNIGCHAGNRCCLIAVSKEEKGILIGYIQWERRSHEYKF